MPVFTIQTPSGVLDIEAPDEQNALAGAQQWHSQNQPAQAHDAGNDGGAFKSAIQGFNSIIPYGNRITAGMGALGASAVTGENVGDLYNQARLDQQATEQASPNANLVGNVLGIAATLPIGISKAVSSTPGIGVAANALQKTAQAAGNFVGRGGNLATKALRSAAVATPAGALYGAGDSENQIEGALTGAGLGFATGAALPVAGAALGAGIGAVGDKISKLIGVKSGEIAKDSLPKELQKVYDRLAADFPDPKDFQKVLYSFQSSGDTLLEQGGKRTQNLAEGAAQFPSGQAKAGEFFDEAVDKAPGEIKNSLSKNVSNSANFSDDVDQILDEGRQKAAPLYKEAFKQNQSIQSPVIDKILQTPEGKSALGEAVKNIQNEMSLVAKPDPELTQLAREVSDLGLMNPAKGGVASGLKLRALDEVKKAMDSTIKQAFRQGNEAEASRIIALKNGLVKEIDVADKNGLYAKARATSGEYLSSKQAMEDGLKFLSDDVENIPRRLSNYTPAQKEAYRAGVVKTLRNNIDNKNDGQNVARLFGKESTRNKLANLLSPKQYQSVMDDAKAIDNIYKLRNQVLGNSRTASRQIAVSEFDDATKEALMNVATKGPTRAAIDTVIGVVQRKFSGLSDTSAKEVANILFEQDPKKKFQIAKNLLNESKRGVGLRSTQAATKLKAFYSISDVIKGINSPISPTALATQNSGSVPRDPLRITITPKDK